MEIIVKNLNITYKTLRQGTPFLILHGWGSKAERWQKVGELLSEKGFQVIIPDLPGFGQSHAPKIAWGLNEYCDFVEDFASALKLDNFYLAGHSFGGALAVKYALRHPAKIKKMFLIGTACIRRKTLKKRILSAFSKILKLFSFLPFYTTIRKGFYKFLIRQSDYLNFEGVMKESYLKIIKEDLSGELANVKVPADIIWGQKDQATPLWQGHLIHKKIPNSRFFVIQNGSHDLENTFPDELAKLLVIR